MYLKLGLTDMTIGRRLIYRNTYPVAPNTASAGFTTGPSVDSIAVGPT